jgi:hypothetical protein
VHLDDGLPAFIGNVESLVGVPGTFAEGLNPGYMYQAPPDEYVDEFGAGTGMLLIRDQADRGRVVLREASGYRTMVSGVIIGAMQGPARDQLLAKYVNFLLHGSGVAEPQALTHVALFSVGPNPARRNELVRFAIPPGQAGFLAVVDAFGRTVKTAPAADARVDVRLDIPAGTYFARLVTPAGSQTLPFVVVR